MSGRMPTIGLTFIARTQAEADALIERLKGYYDEVYYRVGKVDHFAKARNAVLKQVKTDYWYWVDTDDEIEGLDNLREIVAGMEKSGVDVVDLGYEYAYNDLGECIEFQWRERILKTKPDFRWVGRVHETIIAEGADHLRTKDDRIVYQHQKTAEALDQSVERNHKLLLQAWDEDKDPRTAHYLGVSYFNLKQYDDAIKYLLEHVKTSGSPEDQYRSWLMVAQADWFLGNKDMTLRDLNEAIDTMPERPEAFFFKGQFLLDLDKPQAAFQAIEDGRNRPFPEVYAPINKALLTYQPVLNGAMCLLKLGKIKEAWSWFSAAKKLSPKNALIKDLQPLFEGTYGEELAVERIKWLARYLTITTGKPEKLFEALPPQLFMDVRLNRERNEVIKPKTWSDKSIVFFCGQSAEAWGPDTLNKGMGGSEEADLYLSRELSKLGWEVTIFNERDDEYTDKIPTQPNMQLEPVGERYNNTSGSPSRILETNIRYLPWTALNPNDQFNIIVSWRRPTLFSAFPFKAKLKLVDLHDAPVGHVSIPQAAVDSVDKFMFKSQFQRQIASHVPDNKAVIAPNGIVPEHFNVKVKRNPYKVIYASTHDRGLEALLEMWPQIKEQVPEAELHTYYGWDTFRAMHSKNPKQMKWMWDMIRKMHRAGAIDHGRLSHEQLAEEMLSAGIWAYPTMFPEISCITAMKAGAAGLDSVTSGYAALAETQLQGFTFPDNTGIDPLDTYKDPDRQAVFVEAVVQALRSPLSARATVARKYLDQYAWSKVAKLWDAVCQPKT